MFKIDPTANRIRPLQAKRFSDLGFTERKHLQEWLENTPQALAQGDGDELLIIQKEFDGFDDTRERMDLLAIDKEGSLVIVENKLDDTGRDVVWQALKYTGYCANLSKLQVVDIYQRYLNQKAQETGKPAASAEENLAEFLEVDGLEAAQINRIMNQRLILVAARYLKEVTSTLLWLSQFGIACKCFKVTPYQSGEELFLNVVQIILAPESTDFMIGMVAKGRKKEALTQRKINSKHLAKLSANSHWSNAPIRAACIRNGVKNTQMRGILAEKGLKARQ